MYSYNLLAFAASLAAVSATTYQGFNYGTSFTDGSAKQTSDFEAEFKNAQGLEGTNGGFTSARLYTMIQSGTASDPTSAIQAAINTKTSLLLGLWASGGQAGIDSELAALKAAIEQYGSDFAGVVAGISVGSEDLYRITPTGIMNKAGIGAGPDDITSYIGQTRSAIAGTVLEGAPIGHVDTWTAYVNGSNAAVIEACDFLGVDAYPYFQTTDPNSIANGKSVFFDAYYATVSVAQGKPVWITETGWPVSGATSGQAVASISNAKTYWDEVGCESFGNVNIYWYTMQDAEPTTPSPSFGLVGSTLSTTPLFDLTCPQNNVFPSAAPSQVAAASSSTASSSSSTQETNSAAPFPGPTGSGTGSGAGSTATPVSGGSGSGSSTTSTGAAVAPTVRLAGLGMGVVAVGAALVL